MKIIVDGHQDIAWNRLGIGRDFLESVAEKRLREGDEPAHGEGVALVGWPEIQAANIRVIFATIWVQPIDSSYPAPGPRFSNLTQARQQALDQLDYYQAIAQRASVTIVKTQRDLYLAIDEPSYHLGLVLLMEGADPVGKPKELKSWVKRGIRIIAPVWQTNRYGHSSDDPGPLTSLGCSLLAEMMSLGCVLDTAHMSDETSLQAADNFPGVIVNSHSNCRALVSGERQISDLIIQTIASHGGVIGIMPWSVAAKAHRTHSSTKDEFSLRDVVAHIDHVCQITGSSSHVGVGSSFDGGFGSESAPVEIETIGDLPKLATTLAKLGYSELDIKKIMSDNWLGVLSKVLR